VTILVAIWRKKKRSWLTAMREPSNCFSAASSISCREVARDLRPRNAPSKQKDRGGRVLKPHVLSGLSGVRNTVQGVCVVRLCPAPPGQDVGVGNQGTKAILTQEIQTLTPTDPQPYKVLPWRGCPGGWWVRPAPGRWRETS